MPVSLPNSNFSPGILGNLAEIPDSIHTPVMGLDHVLIEFFSRAAAGAASVLMVILVVGLGMPRRSASMIRRGRR